MIVCQYLGEYSMLEELGFSHSLDVGDGQDSNSLRGEELSYLEHSKPACLWYDAVRHLVQPYKVCRVTSAIVKDMLFQDLESLYPAPFLSREGCSKSQDASTLPGWPGVGMNCFHSVQVIFRN